VFVETNVPWDVLNVVDLTGRIVRSIANYSETVLIEGLDTGVYAVQIEIGNTKTTKKLVVQI